MPIAVKDANGTTLNVATNDDVIAALGGLAPKGYGSLLELLNREGDPLSSYSELVLTDMLGAGPSGSGKSATSGLANPIGGRAIFVQSINFGCRTPLTGRFQAGSTPGGWPGVGSTFFQDRAFDCAPGSPTGDLAINTFVSSADKGYVGTNIKRFHDPAGFNAALTIATTTSGSNQLTNVTGAALVVGQVVQGTGIPSNAYITAVSGTTATMSANATASGTGVNVAGPLFTAGASGFTLADSLNFDANKVIAFFSHSIWGTQAASNSIFALPWLTNQFYQDKGISCRYILKAYGGWDSRGHETKRRGGKYVFPRLDALFYTTDVNDAQFGVTPSAYIANVDLFVQWARKVYPGKPVVLLAGTPLGTGGTPGTFYAAQQALRDALSAYVSGLADPLIKFYDQSNAFDRSVASNYQTSDWIHPTDTAHTLNWQGGYNGNAGFRAWLAANLPAV